MVLRVEFVGVNDTIKFLNGVSRRTKGVPNKMTLEMASAFRKRVKSRMPRRKSRISPGHSSPTPLLQRLNSVRKTKGGHTVGFNRSGDFPGLPEAVEYGTKPHIILPKNVRKMRWEDIGGKRFARRVSHPGTRPTYFWSHSIEDFKAQDMTMIVNKGASKIVGR